MYVERQKKIKVTSLIYFIILYRINLIYCPMGPFTLLSPKVCWVGHREGHARTRMSQAPMT